MPKALRPSELVPTGLAVESAVVEKASTIITGRAVAAAGRCSACGGSTWRVHSRYFRTVLDLPLSGRVVRLVIMARRFRCDVALCSQRIFTERFDGQILRPWGRRTARVDDLLHHLGLALGGRPGAGFARRLMLVVGNNTLLRLVRRRARRSVARTLVASMTASRRCFSRLSAMARTSSKASAVIDWSVSSSQTSARHWSDDTISVAAKCRAAKVDLPEPVAPISTTNAKSGMSMSVVSGRLIG